MFNQKGIQIFNLLPVEIQQNVSKMPEINKCRKIPKENEKSNEIYIQMEPPNSLKGCPIIVGPNSPTQR